MGETSQAKGRQGALTGMTIEVIIFDAYGTLFDVYDVEQACEEAYPGRGKEISLTWRQKQLEYTWLRSLMKRYADFDQVTKDALVYSLEKMGLNYNDQQLKTLMALYLRLPHHPEVKQVLERLTAHKLAILSNGTAQTLQQVVNHNQLTTIFDAVLSADPLRVYKPEPAVYQIAVDHFQVEKQNVLFVSSNAWDVAGAKSFGFQVAWVNRSGLPPEQLEVQADFVVKDLQGLLHILQ